MSDRSRLYANLTAPFLDDFRRSRFVRPRAACYAGAMPPSDSIQPTLFSLPAVRLASAPPRPEHLRIAARLPSTIRLGAMTWSFPGWIGLVYAAGTSEKQLAAHGLGAYAEHPLMRMVEIDRSYYEPLPREIYLDFARAVPDDFRFFVKVHEDCTVVRYPMHARYGKKRGLSNPRFLDPAYAVRAVVEPVVAGLGEKLGGLLLQFPPQDVGDRARFVARLHAFLAALPRGPTYAVELRNASLLGPDYAAALADAGAVHCHNAWTAMPPMLTQLRGIPPAARRPLVLRWLLRPNERFADARVRYAPFNRIVAPDPITRELIAMLAVRAHRHGVPTFILVDNKAEGCAPETIAELAQTITEKLAVSAPP